MRLFHLLPLLPLARVRAEDFFWGVATSAFQIEGATGEGGRGPSVWDSFSALEGKISTGDNADVVSPYVLHHRPDCCQDG